MMTYECTWRLRFGSFTVAGEPWFAVLLVSININQLMGLSSMSHSVGSNGTRRKKRPGAAAEDYRIGQSRAR